MANDDARVPLRRVAEGGGVVEEFQEEGGWRVRVSFTAPNKGYILTNAPHEIRVRDRKLAWNIFELAVRLLRFRPE